MSGNIRKLATIIFAAILTQIPAGAAMADGFVGTPFSAEAWFGTEGGMAMRYRLYVGRAGYRLEALQPTNGPDIVIAQFESAQFVYIDMDTGAINFLPMGEDDWGRFHGIACADFEYRKRLGDGEVVGRAAEIWQCIGGTRLQPDTKIWWDPALAYQTRSDEGGYITELRNVEIGEPDISMFNPPGANR